jgi:hypothetical protein
MKTSMTLKSSMALSDKTIDSKSTSMTMMHSKETLKPCNKENTLPASIPREEYQKLIEINLALQKKVGYLSNRNEQLMGIITSYEEKNKALAKTEPSECVNIQKYPASAPRLMTGGSQPDDVNVNDFNCQENKQSMTSTKSFNSQQASGNCNTERNFENFEIDLILRNLEEDNIRTMEIDELRRSVCTLKSLIEHMIRRDGISNRVISFYKKITSEATSTLSEQNRITVNIMEQYVVNLLAENEKMSKALDSLNRKLEKYNERKALEEAEKSLGSFISPKATKKQGWFSFSKIFCEY